MLSGLTQRLLPLLQLTRMALVFTAISNSLCSLLLSVAREGDDRVLSRLDGRQVILTALISIGLYGFGMSLNDIIDRRRDRQLASYRPLPSGRIGVFTAHVICAGLGLLAVVAAILFEQAAEVGWMSLILTVCTGLLIAFYDFAGKYLVASGLLTLGLVRFFHAIIPAPEVPLIWHPLLLFTHVTILSTVAYYWEEKRPALTRLHLWLVIGGVLAIDAATIGALVSIAHERRDFSNLWIEPELLMPLAAALIFILLGWHIWRSKTTRREAGQTLMLTGLLWLIVYDSTFAAGYVGLPYAGVLLLLLPVSYLAVQVMRWWSKILMLSQEPEFRRVRTGLEATRDGMDRR